MIQMDSTPTSPTWIDLIFLIGAFLAGIWVIIDTTLYLKVFGKPHPSKTEIWVYRFIGLLVVIGVGYHLWTLRSYILHGK